jgi:DNA polymerase I-like protein with 3'-5' exonuclease and polymerase domains
MKVAIIDKAPSRNNYSKYFDFEFELFHMSSVPITKLLKKNVTLTKDEFDPDFYDFVILVGSEAAKEYAKVTSVTNYAGQLIKEKFICISNPSMLTFKPEGKPDFERSIERVKGYVSGALKSPLTLGDFKGIIDTKEAKEFLLEVLEFAVDKVGMDTETTALYPRDGYVLGVSITYKKGHGRYISTDALDEECLELLQKIIDKFDIVFHNMKFDIKMMEYHLGVVFRRDHVHDTMVLHYILDENAMHGLKPLAMKYTSYGDYDSQLQEFKKEYCRENGVLEDEFTYDLIPFDIICIYAAIDTAVTLELFEKFYPIVKANNKFFSLYHSLLIPGTLFLMDMEEAGVPMSKERLELADAYLAEEITKAKEKIYEFEEIRTFEKDQGAIFNPNSVQQLRKVLFDYLGLTPTGKLTATGAISTDAEVLEELSEEHPLPAAILRVRQLGKLRNTYISKILPELDKDGCIRTNFNLIFTTSGRLSSSGKLNLQQLPRDNPIIKGCIVAPDGYSIVNQDLRTGEVYYAAVLSGDKNLQKVFITGGDFHSSIAKQVFNLSCAVEDIKSLHPLDRQASKAVTFGVMYGSGASKVADTVNKEGGNLTVYDAQEVINQYFTTFKTLKKWLKSREEFIRANGFTYSWFGRKRRLVNVFSSDKGIAAHEVRSGINSEIQATCSDINLLGAIDTANEIKLKKLDARIIMTVHDSTVAVVRDDLIEEYCEILKRNTQKDRGCSIPGCPIGVDQEVGKDYSFGKWNKTYKLEAGKLSRL